MAVHLTAAVVVPGCLALAWWQATRALQGNTLSWAYTFEWPLFAGYAVYMWWRLLHDRPAGDEAGGGPACGGAVGGEGGGPAAGGDWGAGDPGAGEDAELAAYNRYLGALNASGRQKRW